LAPSDRYRDRRTQPVPTAFPQFLWDSCALFRMAFPIWLLLIGRLP
jgi:hypothetical protein